MNFKLFLNITCIVMAICFFLPWLSIPLFGQNLSAMQIVGHANEINNPLVYSLYAVLMVSVVTLICNQKQSILTDIIIAFTETISILLLLTAIGLIIYNNGGIIKVTDFIGYGAYITLLGLGILSYDLFANQMKKYNVS